MIQNNLVPSVISKKDERQYDIFSRLLSERIIFLTGEVNDAMSDIVVAQLLLLEADNPDKEICLYINSPGGSVSAGLAIYDTMRLIKCPVHTICVGQACSMGAVLLAGGDTRTALEHSRVMIHQPSGGVEGKSTDILITAREIEKVRHILAKILARHTKKSIDEIQRDIENDRFMDAHEAREYGIVDSVMEEQDSMVQDSSVSFI